MKKKKIPKVRKDCKLVSLPEGYGSLTDLAKRLGVSKGRVSQLHKKGAFGDTFTKINQRYYLIDIDTAVENVKKYSDPEVRGFKNKISRLNQRAEDRGQKTEDRGQRTDDGGQRAETAKTIELAGMSFSAARTLKEQYNAEMKKLDFEERSGKLLRDEDVQKGAFEMYRKTRDSLLNIVDRISAQLAAEKKEANVRIILENEIRNALTHIRGRANE
jgi:transcriptional regulator with XRE-family HTH domain